MSDHSANIAQIYRTATPNNPPANLVLKDGELAVEQADPLRLWVGVPTSIDPTGRRLLLSQSANTVYAVRATGAGWALDGVNTVFLLVDSGGVDIVANGAADCVVSLDGVVQQPEIDFTTVGNVLTTTAAPRVDASLWVVVHNRVA